MELSPAEQQEILLRLDRAAPIPASHFNWAVDNGFIEFYDDEVSEDIEFQLTDKARKLLAGR